MVPRVRWTAKFRVEQRIKGDYGPKTLMLWDAEDATTHWSRFRFVAGESYNVGFDKASYGRVKELTVEKKTEEK